MSLSVSLGPFQLSGVMFCLKVLMAFRRTESKELCIISGECDTMAWINRLGTEVTLLDSHVLELNKNISLKALVFI